MVNSKVKTQKKEIIVNGINDIVSKIIEEEKAEGMTKVDIKRVIDSLLNVIDEALINGEVIDFIGHFKMYTEKKEEKEMTLQFGKNKGKTQKVAARLTPRVKFSGVLKKQMIK